MKVEARNLNSTDLTAVKTKNIKRLQELKKEGYSKERLYKIFPKKFVDENY